jgi:hypothetical protein
MKVNIILGSDVRQERVKVTVHVQRNENLISHRELTVNSDVTER